MSDRPTTELTPRSIAAVGSTLLATMLSGAMIANVAISVFIQTIAADYGWSRGEIGGAVSFLFIGAAISAPLFGKLVDRVGPRRVLLPLTFLSGLLLASISVTGASLPSFYAVHFLLGLATPGAVAYSKLISTWFFRLRGVALTAMGIGMFLAQFGVPPIVREIMVARGWHGAYLAFGAVEVLVSFPILLAFFRERAVSGARAQSRGANEVHPDGASAIRVRDALRDRTFWLLLGAQLAGGVAFMGVGTHVIGMMAQHGVTPPAAVWGLSLFAVGGFVAQLVSGAMLDRFDTPRVIVPFAIVSLLGLLTLYLSWNQPSALTAILLVGFGCGGLTSTMSYFVTRYYGVRNFSSIYGVLYPLLTLVAAPSPILVGAIFDATGSYDAAIALLGALLFLTVGFSLMLPRYPYPVRAAAPPLDVPTVVPASSQPGA
jgi:MFS family permease